MKKIIMHIDANNAFLSWTACDMLKHGSKVDIRNIPSIIGGDQAKRAGIVLAKSEVAKKCGVKTAETIYEAKSKCKNLQVFPPNFSVYSYYSNAMYDILCNYSDVIERYSIDECFLDYTSMQLLYGDVMETAKVISNRIHNELGFTVNIGIGDNLFLAKMASELEKPNKIHTIYYNEIKEKMWPLPLDEMFMVGRKTVPELKKMNIYTIGDLAKFDVKVLEKRFGKMGLQMYNNANGMDIWNVNGEKHEYKGMSNSVTTSVDVNNREIAYTVLLSVCETLCRRMRKENMLAKCVGVSIKLANFEMVSHQKKFSIAIDNTKQIYGIAKELFNQIWQGQSIRSFGIKVDNLIKNGDNQISLFDNRDKKIDKVLDDAKEKFGKKYIKKAIFLNDEMDFVDKKC